MRFVSGKHTLASVAEFLKSEDVEIALAVAFWGGAAMERLGVAEWKAKNVRVICNATSGACNPRALKDLWSHIGSNLRTNPNLHSKVYWTPTKLVVTSANASASGLSLQDEEVKGNIEAGIVSTSQQLLAEAKKWFDEVYDAPETFEVDEKTIEQAEQRWSARRPGRLSEQIGNVTAALRHRANLEDRNIWILNYKSEGRSDEGIKQHKILQHKWQTKQLIAPVVARGEVSFDGVDDYEEVSVAEYHWKSWVVDITERKPCFYFVPDKGNIIKNTKEKTKTVPIYRALKVPFGPNQWMAVSRNDITELRKRWTNKIGPKNDRWVPLQELAD
jgi:hypothetical protein